MKIFYFPVTQAEFCDVKLETNDFEMRFEHVSWMKWSGSNWGLCNKHVIFD